MSSVPKIHLRKDYRVTFCGRSLHVVNFIPTYDGVTCGGCKKKHNYELEETGFVDYYEGEIKVENNDYERRCNRSDCLKTFKTSNKFKKNCGCNKASDVQFGWNER